MKHTHSMLINSINNILPKLINHIQHAKHNSLNFATKKTQNKKIVKTVFTSSPTIAPYATPTLTFKNKCHDNGQRLFIEKIQGENNENAIKN